MSIATEISRLQTAKSDLKTSINAKGGTLTTETLDDYAAAVDGLSGGTYEGDAVVGDVLSGKTFYGNSSTKLTGTMTDREGDNACSSSSVSGTTLKLVAPAGYYDGDDTVTITDADFVAGNVKSGVDIFGVTGTYEAGVSAVAKKDVNFYDYDGTIVASYTIAEANALSALPSAPDRSSDGLTFEQWNHTLSVVQATTSRLDVGATFTTTDGKTHLYITLTEASGLSPTLYFNKSNTAQLTIDWGDGNTSTTSASGNISIGHTYSGYGDYVIKMFISSGSGLYYLSDSTNCILGATYDITLQKVFIGSNVGSISSYSFYGCNSLKYITIPTTCTTMGSSTFNACYSLVALTLPSGMNYVRDFDTCYSLTVISLPQNITALTASCLRNCYSLKSIVLPSSLTNIYAQALYAGYANAEIVLRTTTPPTLSATTALSGGAALRKIKVPSSAAATYKAATYWSTFASSIEGY